MSIVYVIGGDEILVMGTPDEVMGALYPPAPAPKRAGMRSVGTQ